MEDIIDITSLLIYTGQYDTITEILTWRKMTRSQLR